MNTEELKDQTVEEERLPDVSADAVLAAKESTATTTEAAQVALRQAKAKELIKVYEWLRGESASHLRTDHKDGMGFSFYNRKKINLGKGRLMPCVEWLLRLGFREGMEINGYRIVYQAETTRFPSSLTFFVIDEPVEIPEDMAFMIPDEDDIPY